MGASGIRVVRNISAGAVAAIAAWSSYSHMVHVALACHERPEVAYALPGSVDGMLIVASIVMVDDKRRGQKVRPIARLAFAAGMLASIAANVAAAHPSIGARTVDAWPALALLLVVEMLARPPASAADAAKQPHVPPPAQVPPHSEVPPRREVPPLALVVPRLPPQPAAAATAGRGRAADVVARPTRAAGPAGTRGRELRHAVEQHPDGEVPPHVQVAPVEVPPAREVPAAVEVPPDREVPPAEVPREGPPAPQVPPGADVPPRGTAPPGAAAVRAAAGVHSRRGGSATELRNCASGSMPSGGSSGTRTRRPTAATLQLARQIIAAEPTLPRAQVAARLGVSPRRLREVLATAA